MEKKDKSIPDILLDLAIERDKLKITPPLKTMENNKWEEQFDKHISSYEQCDNFNLLSACRAKYGDVALEDFLEDIKSFINNLLSQQSTQLAEKIEGMKKNYHSGNSSEILYKDGFNDAIQNVLNLIKNK